GATVASAPIGYRLSRVCSWGTLYRPEQSLQTRPSASTARLPPITSTSPSARQPIRGVTLGLCFLRDPTRYAIRLAPTPVAMGEYVSGYAVPSYHVSHP